VLLGGAGGIPGSGDVFSGVGSQQKPGGGVPVQMRLKYVYEFFPVPFGQDQHPAAWV